MSRAARALAVAAGVAFGTALIVYYIVSYLMVSPPVVAATGSKPRGHLTLQTVASFGNAPHPDWVSYLVRNPSGKWVHGTVLGVPAYSTVMSPSTSSTRRRACAIPSGASRAGRLAGR